VTWCSWNRGRFTALQFTKERCPDGVKRGVFVSLREFAKRMGLQDTSHETLDGVWQRIKRLTRANIEFSLAGGGTKVGNLIDGAEHYPGRGYWIRMDVGLTEAFLMDDHQFRIQIARRESLSGALAKWLHDFLSTHEPRSYTLPYLRQLSGYGGKKCEFPRDLRKALAELTKKIPQLARSFRIIQTGRDSDGWTVEIERGAEKPKFLAPTMALAVAPANAKAATPCARKPKRALQL
jgi:hypothetical protein